MKQRSMFSFGITTFVLTSQSGGGGGGGEGAAGGGGGGKATKIKPNEKCPRGSGKKYKKCHGAN